MKPIRSGNRAISVQTKGEPLAIVATTTQSPMAMMPTEISSESTLSTVAILPAFCRPAFKDNRVIWRFGSTDQKVKILFVPLKFSLSQCGVLRGGPSSFARCRLIACIMPIQANIIGPALLVRFVPEGDVADDNNL